MLRFRTDRCRPTEGKIVDNNTPLMSIMTLHTILILVARNAMIPIAPRGYRAGAPVSAD